MNLYEAVRILEECGSDQDPIKCKEFPKAESVSELADHLSDWCEADKIRIRYWRGASNGWVNGTIGGMIKDRATMEFGKLRKKQKCPTCGQKVK